MRTIDILVKEHELILEALDYLAAARDGLEKRRRPPRGFFEKAIEFAREFADRYHHFKEEYLLFGLLAQKQEGDFDVEIGALRYGHERGRKCINAMAESIDGYTNGDEIATTRLLENLAAYISILKRHIFTEDRVFFDLVEQELSENDDEVLLVQFQKGIETMDSQEALDKSRILVDEMKAIIGELKWQNGESTAGNI
jgi:hemerythrin-like domain-containing protein